MENTWASGRSTLSYVDLEDTEGKLITQLEVHEDTLFAGFRKGGLASFDWHTGKRTQELKLTDDGSVISFSVVDNGKKVVSGGSDTFLKIWDVETGALSHSLEGHSKEISCLYATDRAAISGSPDECINVWDLRKAKSIKTLYPSGFIMDVKGLQNLIITSTPHGIKVWDMAKGQVFKEFRVGGCMRHIDLSADKSKLLIGSTDKKSNGIITVVSTTTWEEVMVIRTLGDSGRGFEGAFNVYMDAEKIICGGLQSDTEEQGKIHVWDAEGKYLYTLKDPHGAPSKSFKVTPTAIITRPPVKSKNNSGPNKTIALYSIV